MGRLRMLLLLITFFIIASLLAVYNFGQFAKRAKGQETYALPVNNEQTRLDRVLTPALNAHPHESSLTLIPSNLDAFAIRAMSAREAGRSIDLQYYIWKDDITGQLLGLELLEAADRGVRVRILLDDLNSHGYSSMLAIINQHPNIDIRMFNPTRARGNPLFRGIEILLRAFSINRRMHNKAWIVDGRIAIVGGRNIANEYFDAAESRNFFDVDLLTAGVAVQETETIFDDFWNSDASIPLSALYKVSEQDLINLKEKINQQKSSLSALPYLEKLKQSPSVQSLFNGNWSQTGWKLYWSNDVHVYSDPAVKVFDEDQENWLYRQLWSSLNQAKHSIHLISPYFVPGKHGVQQFAKLQKQGTNVNILTNSLVANDVIMAHGGYAPYRKSLLQNGIQLHELKPFGKTSRSLIGNSGASLHTKAFLVDENTGFVGSFNFDPRSTNLNTEMGIIFHVPEIIQSLEQEFILRSSDRYSYHVYLENNQLRWFDADDKDDSTIWQHDPESHWWQRAVAKIIGYLPIESQL